MNLFSKSKRYVNMVDSQADSGRVTFALNKIQKVFIDIVWMNRFLLLMTSYSLVNPGDFVNSKRHK